MKTLLIRVSCTGLRPSASATQICETHSLFSPSIAAVPTTFVAYLALAFAFHPVVIGVPVFGR